MIHYLHKGQSLIEKDAILAKSSVGDYFFEFTDDCVILMKKGFIWGVITIGKFRKSTK